MFYDDIILSPEEKKMNRAYEQGEFKNVSNLTEQKQYFKIVADNTLKKTKHINIRLTERDVQKLKSKGLEKGIPYQTLASSILHQYANGQIAASL